MLIHVPATQIFRSWCIDQIAKLDLEPLLTVPNAVYAHVYYCDGETSEIAMYPNEVVGATQRLLSDDDVRHLIVVGLVRPPPGETPSTIAAAFWELGAGRAMLTATLPLVSDHDRLTVGAYHLIDASDAPGVH
jgi:hypothetical protein